MRAVVVGASGTIGGFVVEALEREGIDVVSAGRRSEPAIDLEKPDSMSSFFQKVGEVDAVLVTSGAVPFVPLEQATSENLSSGVRNKMLGQLNAAIASLPLLKDKGSITLTSGILTEHPVKNGVIAAAVNGGIEAFVRTAITDLPRGIRINAVSPNMLEESRDSYGVAFKGFGSVEGERVAEAYVRSVLGVETGQIFRVW